MAASKYSDNVFINCPFDKKFDDIFHAMTFTIFDCGFVARCAREESDGAEVRIEKIIKIIRESKFGIHDISRTELSPETKLPRFNMPLELGLFIGAKRYGDVRQKQKACLITDKSKFRYFKFISDINGQDVEAHGNSVPESIKLVTNWLRNTSRRKSIPGGSEIARRHTLFSKELPNMCVKSKIKVAELGFNDYVGYVSEWIRQNPTL